MKRVTVYIPDTFDEAFLDEEGDSLWLGESSDGEGRFVTFQAKVGDRGTILKFNEESIQSIRDSLTEWLDAPASDVKEPTT